MAYALVSLERTEEGKAAIAASDAAAQVTGLGVATVGGHFAEHASHEVVPQHRPLLALPFTGAQGGLFGRVVPTWVHGDRETW